MADRGQRGPPGRGVGYWDGQRMLGVRKGMCTNNSTLQILLRFNPLRTLKLKKKFEFLRSCSLNRNRIMGEEYLLITYGLKT